MRSSRSGNDASHLITDQDESSAGPVSAADPWSSTNASSPDASPAWLFSGEGGRGGDLRPSGVRVALPWLAASSTAPSRSRFISSPPRGSEGPNEEDDSVGARDLSDLSESGSASKDDEAAIDTSERDGVSPELPLLNKLSREEWRCI
jgi:hypothetical protein